MSIWTRPQRTRPRPATGPGARSRPRLELLEDRTTPATLTWVGDIDGNWGSGTSGTDTNWDTNTLPVDNDILVFPSGAANTTNTNDIGALSLAVIQVDSADYSITVNSLTVGSLGMSGGTITSGVLTLNGNVTTSVAATASSIINGHLDLGSATRTFALEDSSAVVDDLIINAVISGTGSAGLTKQGAGTLVLGGQNTYTGPTAINTGPLKLAVNNALSDSTTVSVNTTGTFNVNSFTDTIGALRNGASGGGPVTLGATGHLTSEADNSTGTFGGVFTGAAGSTFEKVGTGTLTLSGNSPAFLGTTTISDGTLLVTGNRGASSVTVATGGTLGGTGTVGPITSTGGTVSPGTSPGILNVTGAVSLDATSTFVAEINGLTPGNGANNHDQLNVVGIGSDVTLAGTLQVSVGADFVPPGGNSFTIIQTTGTLTGTFVGLPDGATFTAGAHSFRINYTANSVVLTPVEGTTTFLVGAPNPSAFGNNVTFTVTVTPASGIGTATGTVDIIDSTTGTLLADDLALSGGSASIMVNTLTPGPHEIRASYTPSGSGFGASSGTFTQNINNGPTTTFLTNAPNPSQAGGTVFFTATVTSDSFDATASPTGNVSFFDGSTPIGSAQLDDVTGLALLTTTFTTVGPHNITARYTGDFYFAESPTSNTVIQNVGSETFTILVGEPDRQSFGQDVTLTATVGPASGTGTVTGDVRFTDFITGTLLGTRTLSGGSASLTTNTLPPGHRAIQADYIGGSGFGSSSDTFIQLINNGPTTTVLADGTPNPSGIGQQVTFTATVTSNIDGAIESPTGIVDFFDGNTPIGSAELSNVGGQMQATLQTTALTTAGLHNITAQYTGDFFFAESPISNTVDQTVDPSATATTIVSSDLNSIPGQTVTFTATVSSGGGTPTGTITFRVDGGGDTIVPLNAQGQASFSTSTLSIGQHTITATYTSNNPNFTDSSAPPLTQTVAAVPTTTTLVSTDPNSIPGQSVTFTATVTAPEGGTPTGTVTFRIDGGVAVVVPLSGGTALFSTSTLSVGTHTITADYTSDSIVFDNSSASPFTQTVGAVTTTTTLSSSSPTSLPGDPVTFTAAVTDPAGGTPTGTVTFRVDGGNAVVVPLDPTGRAAFTTANLAVGSHAITADYTSDSATFLNSRADLVHTVGEVPFFDGRTQLVVAAGAGGQPMVRIIDALTGAAAREFLVFPASLRTGVRVAVGDVNGDGVADIITAPGSGAAPHVKVFSGRDGSLLASFFAYDVGFTGGVNVTAGDVDGDGFADIITGAGPGAGPHVKAFSGRDGSLMQSFLAYPGFLGGVTVGAGDVNGDGRADIITGAGPGAGPHVKAFSGRDGSLLASFFAYGVGFSGGVNVATGDVNGDGFADIITGVGPGAGPHVKAFSGRSTAELASFFAYGAGFGGGVNVAGRDVDGDGFADIITGTGPGAGPHVKVFDGASPTLLASYFALDAAAASGGVFVG